MVIFHCYVSLPEGICTLPWPTYYQPPNITTNHRVPEDFGDSESPKKHPPWKTATNSIDFIDFPLKNDSVSSC